MVDIGIDLGTSAVKVVAVRDDQVLAVEQVPLTLSCPAPHWAEQSPHDWWQATDQAVSALRHRLGAAWSDVAAIGLSGQMHGAVLLGEHDEVLRPAILWNDTRSVAQCRQLEAAVPELGQITGNLCMPGFTAPKVLWVQQHEPEIRARLRRVLLPKDWLRSRITGGFVSDMSDACGTLWLDAGQRAWSPRMVAATGLQACHLPDLIEGSAVAGTVCASTAARWGLADGVLVAGGGADNAASAVGVGAVDPGEGFVSLGTSGVCLVVSDGLVVNTRDAVHAMCHALPQRWYQMTVALSAADSLAWLAKACSASDVTGLARLAEDTGAVQRSRAPLFLPYLNGERTPHNDADVAGAFLGLRSAHGTADLAYAVMEGVAFAMVDGIAAMRRAGTAVQGPLTLIGGGARSHLWACLIASAGDVTLVLREGSDVGAAFGAARLAALCRGGMDATQLGPGQVTTSVEPEIEIKPLLAERLDRFRRAYPLVRQV